MSTDTPVPTDTPVSTDTPVPTDTPTATATDTPVPTNTPTATATDTPVPTPTPTPGSQKNPPQQDPPPSVRIDGLPSVFDQGQETPFNMIFESLADSKTDQYTYRADVINAEDDAVADGCEGTGLGGVGQYTAQLDAGKDGQDSVPGVIDALCPPGTYTLTVTLMATSGLGLTVNQAFQVLESAPSVIEEDEPPPPPPTATPTPTATPVPTPTPTVKVVYVPPLQQKEEPPQLPTPTHTPTATPLPTPTPRQRRRPQQRLRPRQLQRRTRQTGAWLASGPLS